MASEMSDGKMGVGQITFFCICSVIVLSTVTSAASMGFAGFFWWLVVLCIFVIPNALVTAELGTCYPSEGGTYEWISQAFGPRMATRATFFYWTSNGIWIPSGLILVVGTLSSAFFPDLGLWEQVALVLALTWVIIGIVCYKVEVGVGVTVTTTIIKIIIVITLGLSGIYYFMTHGSANEISIASFTPNFSSGFGYFSVILYNVTGLELVACMGSVLRNPEKDMPRAMVLAAFCVVGLYMLGILGIVLAVPMSELDLVNGMGQALINVYGPTSIVLYLITLLFSLSIVGDLVTWTMAPSRAAAEAAAQGHLPAIIGKWHPKFKTPYVAAIVLGLIGSAITIFYTFLASGGNSDLFWRIFSFSSVLIISSYIPLYASFFKLRIKDKDRPRPFTVPGGRFSYVIGALVLFFVFLAVILFMFPDIFQLKIDWGQSGPTLIGYILFGLLGEIIIRYAEKKSGADPFKAEPLPYPNMDND